MTASIVPDRCSKDGKICTYDECEEYAECMACGSCMKEVYHAKMFGGFLDARP